MLDLAFPEDIVRDPSLDGVSLGGRRVANRQMFFLTLSESQADCADQSFIDGNGFRIAYF
jgi:hypothetical protein